MTYTPQEMAAMAGAAIVAAALTNAQSKEYGNDPEETKAVAEVYLEWIKAKTL